MNVERAATIDSQAAFLLRADVALHADLVMKQRARPGACSESVNADLRVPGANVGRANMPSLVAPPVTIGTPSRTRRVLPAASETPVTVRCTNYRGGALCPLPGVGAMRRSDGQTVARATGRDRRNGWRRRARHVCLAKEVPGTHRRSFTDSERARRFARRFATWAQGEARQ